MLKFHVEFFRPGIRCGSTHFGISYGKKIFSDILRHMTVKRCVVGVLLAVANFVLKRIKNDWVQSWATLCGRGVASGHTNGIGL
jgi:hypothetical protein